MLQRRSFILSLVSAGFFSTFSRVSSAMAEVEKGAGPLKDMDADKKLPAPAKGPIPVAFVISEGVTVIDFAGPWDVFVSVMMPERGPAMTDQMPLYGVGQTGSGNSRGRNEGGAALHLRECARVQGGRDRGAARVG